MLARLRSAHAAWRRFEAAHWHKIDVVLLVWIGAATLIGLDSWRPWELVVSGVLIGSILGELLFRHYAEKFRDLNDRWAELCRSQIEQSDEMRKLLDRWEGVAAEASFRLKGGPLS